MAIIITYDVPTKHVELKKALFALGYIETLNHSDASKTNGIIYFPNTTVLHKTKTAGQAITDLQTITKQLSIELERCIATQWGPDWSAVWGKPFGQ